MSVALTDTEDELFGFFQCKIGVNFVVSDSSYFAGGVNQPTQDSGTLDDAPIVLDVAAGGNLVDQRCDIAGTTNILQFVAPLQFVADGDEVCRLALLVKLHDHLIDGAVRVAIEIVGSQEISYLDNRLWVNNDTAQDAALGFYVLW